MIELNHVSFAYPKMADTLQDISFQIATGERVGLIGANGAGKSTLLKAMLGLLETKGSISVDGTTMARESLSEIRRKLGFVLQDSDSQMFMPSVYEDMMFGPLNYKVSREEAEKRVDEALEQLGITHLKHRQNHKLSGGEKRLAAIATILAMQPTALLMDEPSAALDPKNRRKLIQILNRLSMTKLVATHDLDLVLDTCDRVLILHEGVLVADGPVKELLYDEDLLEQNGLELPLGVASRH